MNFNCGHCDNPYCNIELPEDRCEVCGSSFKTQATRVVFGWVVLTYCLWHHRAGRSQKEKTKTHEKTDIEEIEIEIRIKTRRLKIEIDIDAPIRLHIRGLRDIGVVYQDGAQTRCHSG